MLFDNQQFVQKGTVLCIHEHYCSTTVTVCLHRRSSVISSLMSDWEHGETFQISCVGLNVTKGIWKSYKTNVTISAYQHLWSSPINTFIYLEFTQNPKNKSLLYDYILFLVFVWINVMRPNVLISEIVVSRFWDLRTEPGLLFSCCLSSCLWKEKLHYVQTWIWYWSFYSTHSFTIKESKCIS